MPTIITDLIERSGWLLFMWAYGRPDTCDNDYKGDCGIDGYFRAFHKLKERPISEYHPLVKKFGDSIGRSGGYSLLTVGASRTDRDPFEFLIHGPLEGTLDDLVVGAKNESAYFFDIGMYSSTLEDGSGRQACPHVLAACPKDAADSLAKYLASDPAKLHHILKEMFPEKTFPNSRRNIIDKLTPSSNLVLCKAKDLKHVMPMKADHDNEDIRNMLGAIKKAGINFHYNASL